MAGGRSVTRTARAEPAFWRQSPLILASAGVHAAALVTVAASPASWPIALAALVANHAAIAAASMAPRSRLARPQRQPAARSPGRGDRADLRRRPGSRRDAAGARASRPGRRRRHVLLHRGVRRSAIRSSSPRSARAATGSRTTPSATARDSRSAGRRRCAPRCGADSWPWRRRGRRGRASSGRRPACRTRGCRRCSPPKGLALVSWTRRGFDTVTRDPHRVAQRLARNLAEGDILLLHDGRSARTASGAPVVLEALARVLDEMAARGLRSAALGAVLAGAAPGGALGPGRQILAEHAAAHIAGDAVEAGLPQRGQDRFGRHAVLDRVPEVVHHPPRLGPAGAQSGHAGHDGFAGRGG